MHPLFTLKGNIGYIHKCVKDWLQLSINIAIYLEKAKHHTKKMTPVKARVINLEYG